MQYEIHCDNCGDLIPGLEITLADDASGEIIARALSAYRCESCVAEIAAERQAREALLQAQEAFRTQLGEMWDAMAGALPVLQRAQLRQVKITVVDALDAGRFDEAAALIGVQPVPPEFVPTQQYAVAMLEQLAQENA